MTTPERLDPRIQAQIAVDPTMELSRSGDDWVLQAVRLLPHEPERVWRMLTEPAGLARWSPLVPDRPLTSIGPAGSREQPEDEPVDATVLEVDPPHHLVHRWGEHTLVWDLTPTADGGTRLRLRHRFGRRNDAASFAGGWHLCLAALAATFDGAAEQDTERVVGRRALEYGWEGLRDQYDARFGPAGVDLGAVS